MRKRILCLLLALFMFCTAACSEVADVALSLLEEGTATEESAVPSASDSAAPAQNVGEENSADSEEESGKEELVAIPEEIVPDEAFLPENGAYSSKEDVALYLHLYGHLPENFITKKEANALGWEEGSLEPYAPGMCIGGDRFGNYENLLPEKTDRDYYECDIDTLGASKRGAKRIVFSNDGLVYYTDDHYESFTLLYGEENEW